MRTVAVLFLTSLFTLSLAPTAASGAETGAYKVEFDIHDSNDASAKVTRRYVMMVQGNDRSVFRLGQKVPYATGSVHTAGSTAVSTQFNYAEVGVNIDCRLDELEGKIRMRATLDLSTLVGQDKIQTATVPMPIIGQLRTDVNALLTAGKPTMVASVDDPVTSRRFDVEATVTKVN